MSFALGKYVTLILYIVTQLYNKTPEFISSVKQQFRINGPISLLSFPTSLPQPFVNTIILLTYNRSSIFSECIFDWHHGIHGFLCLFYPTCGPRESIHCPSLIRSVGKGSISVSWLSNILLHVCTAFLYLFISKLIIKLFQSLDFCAYYCHKCLFNK